MQKTANQRASRKRGVSFYLSAEDRAKVKKAAKKLRLGESAYIAHRLMPVVEQDLKVNQ